jgi:hypothetical protein
VLEDVRFGSKADMCSATRDVCFTPNSDIRLRRYLRTIIFCQEVGTISLLLKPYRRLI